MRLARPSEVPLTCAISGLVVVLAIFEFGGTRTWLYELVIFSAWGLIYLAEWGWRSSTGRRPSGSVKGDAQA